MEKHQILIVSSDQEFIASCRQTLSFFVNVSTASSGTEGAKQINLKQCYSVVFIDFKLPDMTGMACIEKIQFLAQCTIVLTAAHRDVPYALEWANKNHIFRLLAKPCEKETLSIVLQDGLNHYLTLERKKQVEEKLLYLSITDPLTGCYTRTYLNDRLPEEMSKAHRYKRNLSIILCNIDDIKSINKNFGNWAGDQVLINFVQCAKDILRKRIDLIYRSSQDNFLVVLPETTIENAMHVAERLRSASSKTNLSSDSKLIHFTVSLGVSSYNTNTYDVIGTPDVFLDHAERSLHKAKEYGGNTVMCSQK